MKIKQSSVKRIGSSFEQTLAYRQAGRNRKEIFCGRTPIELRLMIAERLAELRRERRNDG